MLLHASIHLFRVSVGCVFSVVFLSQYFKKVDSVSYSFEFFKLINLDVTQLDLIVPILIRFLSESDSGCYCHNLRMGIDPWVRGAPHGIPFLKDTFHHLADLFVRPLSFWIYSIFSPQHAALISALQPPSSNKLNFWKWTPTTDGSFFVRKFWQNSFIPNASHFSSQWSWTNRWKLPLPPRLKLLGWKVCHNLLPTNVRRQHHLQVPLECVLCASQVETTSHLLHSCAFIHAIWFTAFGIQTSLWHISSPIDIIRTVFRYDQKHNGEHSHFLLNALLVFDTNGTVEILLSWEMIIFRYNKCSTLFVKNGNYTLSSYTLLMVIIIILVFILACWCFS